MTGALTILGADGFGTDFLLVRAGELATLRLSRVRAHAHARETANSKGDRAGRSGPLPPS